jgi:hypothetical protein
MSHADVFAAARSMARHGSAESLDALLTEYPDFLRVDPRHPPPPSLCPDLVLADAVALHARCHETVAALLRHGGNPNAHTPNGQPVLQVALLKHEGDDLALVELLLDGGADPNWDTRGGMRLTALITAIQKSRYEIVRRLLMAGADPNTPCFDAAPLAHALMAARPTLVPLLRKHGASPEYAALIDPKFDLAAIEQACHRPQESAAPRRETVHDRIARGRGMRP